MKAESATSDLISIIRAMGGTVEVVDIATIVSGTYGEDKTGVYFFFHVTQIDPYRLTAIYCGSTADSFGVGYKNHDKSGILREWQSGLLTTILPVRPTNGLIGVGQITTTSGAMARLLEGCFLKIADFPCNHNDNYGARPIEVREDAILDASSPSGGDLWPMIGEQLKAAKSELDDLLGKWY